MGGVRPLGGGPARIHATPAGPRGRERATQEAAPPRAAPDAAVAHGVRQELHDARETIRGLEAALSAAEGAADAARQEAEKARATVAAIARRAEDAEAAIADAERARDAADHERRAVQQQLAKERDHAREQARPTRAVRDALRARGLADEDEAAWAMRGWLDAGRLDEWLEALDAEDPNALAIFLEQRVSLVCDAEGCTPLAGAVVVPVAPERCDVCGGSDTRRALEHFVERCVESGLRRVRIVGGSPNYHTELRRLLGGDRRIELKLIRGDGRRNQNDAKNDQKHADIVIIWGGTILDHSTSGHYDPSAGRVLIVAHRGIAGMLQRATEALGQGQRN